MTNPLWDKPPKRKNPCRTCQGHGLTIWYPYEAGCEFVKCWRCKGKGEDRDTIPERLKKLYEDCLNYRPTFWSKVR